MVLPEFLGTAGGLVLAIATSVGALVLGHGALVAILALPVGFLAGWLVGIGTTPLFLGGAPPNARNRDEPQEREEER